MPRAGLWLAFAAVVLMAEPAGAQQRPRPATPPAAVAPPVEAPPAAYEPQLLKLAEVLGAMSFLSELCSTPSADGKGDQWRRKMIELMEAEAQGEGQKGRLAGAFNRGYAGYRTTYRVCTPNGRLALERLGRDGVRLASELSGRFGS